MNENWRKITMLPSDCERLKQMVKKYGVEAVQKYLDTIKGDKKK